MSIVRSRPRPRPLRGARSAAASLVVLALVVLLAAAGQGTAHAASPTLFNQASASGFPAGSEIYDTVTLGGGVNPTGTLTFTLFGPDNPTCAGTPIFTATTAVSGNAFYESSRFRTFAAGTYTWLAAYGGDANNTASPPTPCSTPSAKVTVAKRTPVLTVASSWASPSAFADGVLSSGSGPAGPTGKMTYNLYGPNNMTCAGTPIFSSVRTVAFHLSSASGPFNPSALGAYQWVVAYSGDANNTARSTICSDSGLRFTMATPNPTVVSGSPTTVARGGTVSVNWSGIVSPTSTDWVGLYAVGAVHGGPVTAWKYTTGTASGSVTLKFPWSATAGSYEIRLMADNDTTRLATSTPLSLVW